MDGETYDEDNSFIVKLSGIPYSATVEDVAYFMAGVDIKGGRKQGVHLTKEESGRASGEAFVELMCKEDIAVALKKDHEYMGERWIAVTRATAQEMEDDKDKAGTIKRQLDAKGEYVCKIRGLPWSTTAADIENFFADSVLKDDKTTSIHILRNAEGRLSGQAFVEFKSSDDLENALKRNREHMGKRYLEITRSDMGDLKRLADRSTNVAKNKDPVVLLRGLPFDVTNDDVEKFFHGLSITDVQMVYDSAGIRPMGKAFVAFTSTTDSEKALAMHGERIGSRYVEIFQSNKKYWHERDGEQNMGGLQSRAPGRPRPGPYSREEAPYHAARGGPRIKHMSHARGYAGGYDGADGFPPHQEYGAVAMGGRVAGPGVVAAAGPTKHCVLMKGVSLEVSIGDVIKFFTDTVLPKNVEMKYGEAVVELNTHADAMRAMLKDKEMLGGQRVQLELQSKPADYVGYDNIAQAQPQQEYVDPYGGASYGDPYQSAGAYGVAQQQQGGYKMW